MRRPAAWLLVALGVALAGGLVALARPRAIVDLLARSRPGGLAIAFALAVLVLAFRGMRLALLAGGGFPLLRAIAVTGIVNTAAATFPLRAGDLVLLPMLRAAGVPGTIRGLSLLVSLRLLDVIGLLVWTEVAAILVGGRLGAAALPLAAAPMAAVGGAALGLRLLRRLARRWRRQSGLRRRVLAQLLQARRELREAARSPLRAGGALLLSIAIWGGIWLLTLALVRAMGLTWPASTVLVGVLGATLGAAVPANAVGNFGTLEAGWSAALVSLRVSAPEALAAGFATHLWSLLFSVVLGGAGVVYLVVVGSERRAKRQRNADSDARSSARLE